MKESTLNKMKMVVALLFGFLLVNSLMAENKNAPADRNEGFVWKSEVPKDCPFERSPSLRGIRFSGRHSDYTCGDTWYPSWASDGNLYSPWTDGKTDGMG
ncbi:MAG: hypothetical protein ACYSTZ_07075, partial [Planctomycetota bacterium]